MYVYMYISDKLLYKTLPAHVCELLALGQIALCHPDVCVCVYVFMYTCIFHKLLYKTFSAQICELLGS